MADQPITHKSPQKGLSHFDSILESSNNNGVKCDWSGNDIYDGQAFDGISLKWNFDWRELKDTGVDSLSGQITVTSPYDHFTPQKFDVDLSSGIDEVGKIFHVNDDRAFFEYSLTPHRSTVHKNISYDEMFLPSELNDTILVIDEKRLHVNKTFLSYHSDFFRALFSSKYKEGQMDEIPIEDVSYEDFGLLMSTIYPKTVFPNDKTVEKLLRLADRFLIPSVIGHVEYHLLHNSQINYEKVIWMADEYGMSALFEKCVRQLDTIQKAKKLNTFPEYGQLSKDAKAAILDCIMKLI